jgi:hypothetical protein
LGDWVIFTSRVLYSLSSSHPRVLSSISCLMDSQIEHPLIISHSLQNLTPSIPSFPPLFLPSILTFYPTNLTIGLRSSKWGHGYPHIPHPNPSPPSHLFRTKKNSNQWNRSRESTHWIRHAIRTGHSRLLPVSIWILLSALFPEFHSCSSIWDLILNGCSLAYHPQRRFLPSHCSLDIFVMFVGYPLTFVRYTLVEELMDV